MKVNFSVAKNIFGGLSLCVENQNRTSGTRIAGGKLAGGLTVEQWVVNADELIKLIEYERYDEKTKV